MKMEAKTLRQIDIVITCLLLVVVIVLNIFKLTFFGCIIIGFFIGMLFIKLLDYFLFNLTDKLIKSMLGFSKKLLGDYRTLADKYIKLVNKFIALQKTQKHIKLKKQRPKK